MLKKLNQAMEFIETHLKDDFLLEEITKQINVPDHHFRKIFFALTNMTLNEYVKNRRLSEANKELLQGAQVTDVAYKYGYQSMDGFTRAFKKWSGVLPSQAAKLGQCISCQRLQFVVTVKGGSLMEYRIVEKPAFFFAGVSKRVPMQFEGVNQEIVKLAQSITPEQREEDAPPAKHGAPGGGKRLLRIGHEFSGGSRGTDTHDRRADNGNQHRLRTGHPHGGGAYLGGVPKQRPVSQGPPGYDGQDILEMVADIGL